MCVQPDARPPALPHAIAGGSADARALTLEAQVLGPMSNPIRPRGMDRAGTVRRGASTAGSGAATTSSGSWISTPLESASRTASRTSSYLSGSTSDSPTSAPAAARKENAMAPPTSSASTR